MWGKMILNKYIDLPQNIQNTPHLCWSFNKVKLKFQISDFCRGTSTRRRASPARFYNFFKTVEFATWPRCRLDFWPKAHHVRYADTFLPCVFDAASSATCQVKFGVFSWTPRETLGESDLHFLTLYTQFYLFKIILPVLYLIQHLQTFLKYSSISLVSGGLGCFLMSWL